MKLGLREFPIDLILTEGHEDLTLLVSNVWVINRVGKPLCDFTHLGHKHQPGNLLGVFHGEHISS
jgi:hypothetical protein